MNPTPVNAEHIIAYTAGPTITGLFGIALALVNRRSNRRTESKLHSIDRAVNSRPEGERTIGQNVQDLADRAHNEDRDG